MMLDLDRLTPDEYRARYLDLQSRARALAGASGPTDPPEIPPDDVIATETIPPGAYATLRARRGEALHIVNPAGTPGASIMLWNADDPSERFNAGDTLKLQWTTRLTTGRVLFSDMGRILAAIIADSGAGHDAVLGASAPTDGAARNGRDNLRNAAGKFGLGRRDLATSLTLFADLVVDADATMRLRNPPPPGSFITLRAEMNLLIALSNTPHPLACADATGPIVVTRHRTAPDAAASCRAFSDEARRGFENNDSYFA
jgi:urea carboxylase-associated protein 2